MNGIDEISHAARAFSLLLAGGALARVMKLTAGGRGAFTFEGLDRSELLTVFKCKSPARCAELHDVCGEDEIRTRGTVNPYVSLANWWFQPLTHPSWGFKFPLTEHCSQMRCKGTNYF